MDKFDSLKNEWRVIEDFDGYDMYITESIENQ